MLLSKFTVWTESHIGEIWTTHFSRCSWLSFIPKEKCYHINSRNVTLDRISDGDPKFWIFYVHKPLNRTHVAYWTILVR